MWLAGLNRWGDNIIVLEVVERAVLREVDNNQQ